MVMQFKSAKPDYERIADYFGLWSMREQEFAGLFGLVTDMDLLDHVQRRTITSYTSIDEKKLKALASERDEEQPVADDPLYSVTPGGIAVFQIRGTMMKSESSFMDSTSTVRMRQALRAAKADSSVIAGLTIMETPGGTVAGTQALAQDWADFGACKPTATYIEDLGASAGYWYASQSGFIATNATGIVGSIGTFMAVRDTSGWAKEMNVKVHVIRAGAFKGAGTPGTEITDEQLAAWQEMVNGLNAEFLQAVAAGRKMSMEQVNSIADGRAHVGAAAKSLGLVDAVQSLDETVRQLLDRAGAKQTSSSTKGKKMNEATLDELQSNLVGADDSFILGQMKAKASLAQAQSAWMAEMNKRLSAKSKESDDLKAQLASKPSGVQPLGAGTPTGKEQSEQTENAIQQFGDLVSAKIKGGLTRPAAIAAVATDKPDLHKAFIAATNAGNRKATRLVQEKYGT